MGVLPPPLGVDEEGVEFFAAFEEVVAAVGGVLGGELVGLVAHRLAVVLDGVLFEEVAGFAFGGGEFAEDEGVEDGLGATTSRSMKSPICKLLIFIFHKGCDISSKENC